MTKKSMNKICDIKKNNDTEVWYRYFTHTKLFKVKTIKSEKRHNFNCRLTLDYPADFKLIKKILTYFNYSKSININNIIKYFKLFPKDKSLNIKYNKESTKRFDYQSNLKLKTKIKYKQIVKYAYKDFTEFY
jgi:spore coat polysaccharide biosynthesis protein SpsF (cytidylyltransferase family)